MPRLALRIAIMNFIQRLGASQQAINDDIAQYCDNVLTQTEQQYGLQAREALEPFIDVLGRGGKRLRGALVMATYEMFGGTDRSLAISTARAVEMINAYLLIVDDVADRSEMRRGAPAAHLLMRQYHQQRSLRGDADHFGESMAVHGALLGSYLAELTIDDLQIDAETKLRLLRALHSNLVHTIHGQLRDILNGTLPTVHEQDVLWVSTYKTAYYSLVKPMEIGAVLAGASSEQVALLQTYGLPAGQAFQIADDILGIFGNDAVTGKSAIDDLKEGKITILITHTLEHATPDQRQQLQDMLGNPNITESDLHACRDIIRQTGALQHAEQSAQQLAQKASSALNDFPSEWKPEIIDFLRALTDKLVSRQA